MLLALALFLAGVAEYVLAAYWTHALVTKKVAQTAGVTFLNVMLWGFVVTNLRVSEPRLLVIHGLGCALGAALTCWATKPAEAAAARGALDPPIEAGAPSRSAAEIPI
jgi:hypothetical protein